jgi:RNA polymerase sigma-70 factor (ECF subfamily)
VAASGFEAFFHEEYPRVRAGVRWIVEDDASAEDVAQEAFCRALERWDRVSEHEHPGAWVQVTAVRLAVRRMNRRNRGAELVPSWPAASASQLPDVDLERAIMSLPASQRAVVVLHHLVDLAVSDVAAVLGVAEGTVKTHLHRARARLAEQLNEREEVDDGAR